MIPYPSRVTFGEGTLSLAAQQFSGIGGLQDHLAANGHKTAVWDELLEADPPPGLLFFGWRKEYRALMARAAGFDAVSCPIALAEVAWSSQASHQRDFPEFHARLRRHLPTLDALKVNYRPLD